jgi:hypothetical protein
MSTPPIDSLCVGVCMNDPDSGYCLGCGRPPLPLSAPEREANEGFKNPAAEAPDCPGDSGQPPESPVNRGDAEDGETRPRSS